MRLALFCLTFIAACLTVAGGSLAGPIAIGQWYTFSFGGVGSSFAICMTDCQDGVDPTSIPLPSESPWTVTLPSMGQLIVTDAFVPGDQFSLSDFGIAIGDTSTPTIDETDSCFNDISACLADPEISKGVFSLAAGDHALAGSVIQSPFDGGGGFFEVTLIPEPATAALLALPVVALGLALRRRATKAA